MNLIESIMWGLEKAFIVFFSGIVLVVGAVLITGGTIVMTMVTIIHQQNPDTLLALQIAPLVTILIGVTIASVGTIGIIVGERK